MDFIPNIFNVGFFLSPILTIVWVVLENRRIPKGQISDERFSIAAKIGVVVLCALFPILSGGIFYYGLHKKLPKKAKYANIVSFIVFGLELAFYFYYFKLPIAGY